MAKRTLDRQIVRDVLRQKFGKDLLCVRFTEKPQGVRITTTLKLKGFHRARLTFSGFVTSHEIVASALPVKLHSQMIGENLASLPAYILSVQGESHPSFPATKVVA